jgi:hypothetical protein
MKDRAGKYLVIVKDKLTDLQQQTSPFKNSSIKLIFFKKKVATLSLKISLHLIL